jgi:ATP-binding cassette subfamily F protein 3
MISVDNVTVEFGGRALFGDVTFNVNEKDKIALMGKNGAGKSTLLKIIAGVDKPTRGKIEASRCCYRLFASAFIDRRQLNGI